MYISFEEQKKYLNETVYRVHCGLALEATRRDFVYPTSFEIEKSPRFFYGDYKFETRSEAEAYAADDGATAEAVREQDVFILYAKKHGRYDYEGEFRTLEEAEEQTIHLEWCVATDNINEILYDTLEEAEAAIEEERQEMENI